MRIRSAQPNEFLRRSRETQLEAVWDLNKIISWIEEQETDSLNAATFYTFFQKKTTPPF